MSGIHFGNPKMSFLQNYELQQISLLTTKAGTITGTAGFGSSLFLDRVFVPGSMILTELDFALGLAFAANNNGAGTLSQSFVAYSFVNSTSLSSFLSFSATSAWSSGTSTTAGATSLTQFQGGWTGSMIHPMTFASSSLAAGDFVFGNLINFAQSVGASTWTISLFGAYPGSTSATSTASVFSNAGTANVNLISNVGTGNVNLISNAGTAVAILAIATISTASFAATTQISSLASRTVFNAAPTQAAETVFTVAPTLAAETVFTAAPTAASAVTSLSFGNAFIPFGFVGTGSTTSAFPFVFQNGIMSTGAVPASIALTSTAVTYLGSLAQLQPWFGLVGS